jgi:hypothetical protein
MEMKMDKVGSRRGFLKKAVYIAPAVIVLGSLDAQACATHTATSAVIIKKDPCPVHCDPIDYVQHGGTHSHHHPHH